MFIAYCLMFIAYCLMFIAYSVITILLNISIRLWYFLCLLLIYLSISYSYVANIDLFFQYSFI